MTTETQARSASTASGPSSSNVRTGLDILAAENFRRLEGRRVGLLTNPTAVDRDYRHAIDLMLEAGVRLETIFGPEHGLFSTAQDMIGVGGGGHSVRVVSLYGDSFESLRPKAENLRGLDVLVFDIQDVGSRYYTYVWTLALAMETARETGTPILVLDRPNPISAMDVEGSGLEKVCRSFVGWYEFPNRHGLTVGEIAQFVAGELGGVDLEVVWMEGYRRSMWHDETGAPWVIPSPNMPTLDTAAVYPGQCLLEGTNLSEGRGTTRPFEIFGAPFVDGHRLAEALEAEDLPGVRFRPLRFQPTFQKWAGQECGGLQLHVVDRGAFRSYATALAILRHTSALWPSLFAWRTEEYEFRADVPAIDLLTGVPKLREMIDAGAAVEELRAQAEESGGRARENRKRALHYESR